VTPTPGDTNTADRREATQELFDDTDIEWHHEATQDVFDDTNTAVFTFSKVCDSSH